MLQAGGDDLLIVGPLLDGSRAVAVFGKAVGQPGVDGIDGTATSRIWARPFTTLKRHGDGSLRELGEPIMLSPSSFYR
jgi:hypothetical protein